MKLVEDRRDSRGRDRGRLPRRDGGVHRLQPGPALPLPEDDHFPDYTTDELVAIFESTRREGRLPLRRGAPRPRCRPGSRRSPATRGSATAAWPATCSRRRRPPGQPRGADRRTRPTSSSPRSPPATCPTRPTPTGAPDATPHRQAARGGRRDRDDRRRAPPSGSHLGDDDGDAGGDGDPRETVTVVCITELAGDLRGRSSPRASRSRWRTRARPPTRSWPSGRRRRRVGDDRPLARDGRRGAAGGPAVPALFAPAPHGRRHRATWCSLLAGDDRGRRAGGTASSTPPASSRRSASRRSTPASGCRSSARPSASHMGDRRRSRRQRHPGRVRSGSAAAGPRARGRRRDARWRRQGTAAYIADRHHRAAGGHGAATRLAADGQNLHLGASEVPARADVVVATRWRAATAPTA